MLAIVVFFKSTLAPPNDLVTFAAKQSVWVKLTDPGRYFAIAGELVQRAPFRVYVLPIYAICIGLSARRTAGVALAALPLLLLGSGYFAVYLTTPHDLSWHIYTSMDRLLVQMWPTFVLVYFLLVATPEEIFLSGKRAGGGSAR